LSALYRRFLRLPDFRGKARLGSLIRKHLLESRPITVVDGLEMRLDPIEWPQAELLRDGVLEPLTVALLRRTLRAGDHYVDVGAHVGFHTLVARRAIGAGGRVVAIEPQPYHSAKLLENWRINAFENVVVYVALAAEDTGAATLPLQRASDGSRLSLALPSANDLPQRFRVPCVRLDTVLAEQRLDRVRIIKIDVEGCEDRVLAGLGEAWPRVDGLVVEVLGTPDRVTESSRRAIDMLRERGFTLRDVRGEPWACDRPLDENNVWAARP
jgi:FkbM family methyltransferase